MLELREKSFRARHQAFRSSGYASPEQCLAISGDTGTLLCDYSAHELNVNVGDEITVYKAINGWAWSKNSRDE